MKARKKEQLKIAMLGHKRIPSREGGVEIVVEALSTRMTKWGHQVTCYNRGGHHVSGAEFDTCAMNEFDGVALKTVWTLDRKGLAAVTASISAAVCSAFSKADVVHFHAEGPAFMCWLPKLFGKRVVVTVHGLDWQREKWKNGFGAKYIRAGEKMAVRYADRIIVLSRNMQNYFADTYGRDTVYIPNGVSKLNTVEVDEIARKWGLAKESYVLYLGRLVPEKGCHYLIEAFRKVTTDKKLIIAGGTSDSEDYVQFIKAMAAGDDRIIFTGFVQDRLLEELYSNAYVYVLPSNVEGMPLSLLEAMSYGNCCLVSDIPECVEVVEDKAEIFQNGNVEDLRMHLQRLCDDPAPVAKYKAEVLNYICSKYSWDDVTDQTLKIYRGE